MELLQLFFLLAFASETIATTTAGTTTVTTTVTSTTSGYESATTVTDTTSGYESTTEGTETTSGYASTTTGTQETGDTDTSSTGETTTSGYGNTTNTEETTSGYVETTPTEDTNSTTAAPSDSPPCGSCDCPYKDASGQISSVGNPSPCSCEKVIEQKVPAGTAGYSCCKALLSDPAYKWPRLCNGAKMIRDNADHFPCWNIVEKGCGQCGALQSFPLNGTSQSCCCPRTPDDRRI